MTVGEIFYNFSIYNLIGAIHVIPRVPPQPKMNLTPKGNDREFALYIGYRIKCRVIGTA